MYDNMLCMTTTQPTKAVVGRGSRERQQHARAARHLRGNHDAAVLLCDRAVHKRQAEADTLVFGGVIQIKAMFSRA